MSTFRILTLMAVLPAALGIGMAGAALGTDPAAATSQPLSCEIRETSINGMVALEAIVRADAPVSGSYSFKVVSTGGGGRSNISQGGEFQVGPGVPATLGTVTLGQRGVTFNAQLEVTSGGKRISCSERISL
jgi:hypothetical protein